MANKINSPHRVLLKQWSDGNDRFIEQDAWGYFRPGKDYSNHKIELDFAEALTGAAMILKDIEDVRTTNSQVYFRYEIQNPFGPEVRKFTTAKPKVNVGNTRNNERTYYNTETCKLVIEITAKDSRYLLKYYNCETREYTIPFKDFIINTRTEHPTINLKEHKL